MAKLTGIMLEKRISQIHSRRLSGAPMRGCRAIVFSRAKARFGYRSHLMAVGSAIPPT